MYMYVWPHGLQKLGGNSWHAKCKDKKGVKCNIWYEGGATGDQNIFQARASPLSVSVQGFGQNKTIHIVLY